MTIHNYIGKCSCLKKSDFKVGDRVRVVYVEKNHTSQIDDCGTITRISPTQKKLEVHLDKLQPQYFVLLEPQSIKPIPNNYHPLLGVV